MSSENLSVRSNSAHLTTPGKAHPPSARAAQVLAEKRPVAPKQPEVAARDKPHQAEQREGHREGQDWAKVRVELRLEANISLLQAMFGNQAKRDANAQKINYQEVVMQLEEVLRKELGDDNFSFEKLAATTSGIKGQEDYWSPERTAERIVLGATQHFDAFKKQNPGLSEEEALDKFLNVITPAIEKGFNQAKDILKGFDIFKGEVKDNAERTLDLVYEKLELFRERVLGHPEERPLVDDASGSGH